LNNSDPPLYIHGVTYSRKIILHAPPPQSALLEAFVEACLRENVALICVVGEQCELVEDIIDELIVGDGSDSSRFITTTSHKNESLDNVIQFARSYQESESEPQQVRL
jgi:hypothetical protein